MNLEYGLYMFDKGDAFLGAYNVLGTAKNTESGREFIVCQRVGDKSFHGRLEHVPSEVFREGMSYGVIVHAFPAVFPILVSPDRIAQFSKGSPPGCYRHFKGGTYNVLGVSVNTHAQERCVLYQPLYGESKFSFCLRPAAMWMEHVDKPEFNYSGARFVLTVAYQEAMIADA